MGNMIRKRKLIFGKGLNDADYVVTSKEAGVRISCSYYQRWRDMLKRAYSEVYHLSRPTYKDVKVCDDWLLFSNFKIWMEGQDWEGKHLDKDILIPGNKIYSPEHCIFVTSALNTLLNDCRSARGEYFKGVSLHKGTNRFISQIKIKGKSKYLGLFDTPEEASNVYLKVKISEIRSQQALQTDSRIIEGLEKHIERLVEGII